MAKSRKRNQQNAPDVLRGSTLFLHLSRVKQSVNQGFLLVSKKRSVKPPDKRAAKQPALCAPGDLRTGASHLLQSIHVHQKAIPTTLKQSAKVAQIHRQFLFRGRLKPVPAVQTRAHFEK